MLPSATAADILTLGQFYRRICDRYGESVAIATPERTLTYADIADEATKLEGS
jgi:hypothetical protein